MQKTRTTWVAYAVLAWALLPDSAFGQQAQGPATVTLDQAIQLAIQHNHGLLANRTAVLQNQAQEITANLRPNPTLFTDWEYIPLPGVHPGGGLGTYLHDSTEGDVGLSYLFERGKKRQHRLQAAKDTTAVTRSTVVDNERTLAYQVAQLYYNVQLAKSTLELANSDLKSFQTTVDISENQYKVGTISQNDYLQIKLQLATFQTNVEQAELARDQALSDLRQQLGYESVPSEYDIAGPFEYVPLTVKIEDLQAKALANRPDLRAAVLGITAANSQYQLAKANGKQDVSVSANYSHVNAISAVTWSVSVPLPIFDRNQGNIAQTHAAITQAQEQQLQARGQVLDDVRDAYVGVQSNGRLVQIYRSGILDDAKLSRDISEYSYRRGATALLDFLVAQRNYDAIELAYRQALAAYLTSIEQLRQAVGSRDLS
ncbi:MAG TPA: TolC family protein [Bryobacteraceae bacterium]|nr:TolC family protein [Bryobacteraceae bacterium]